MINTPRLDTASPPLEDTPPTYLIPLVAIVGPTAAGKSSLGVRIAEEFGGEVVACDSTQVYRGLDIGTAKPAVEERRGVPHHMMDLVDTGEVFSAGEYRRRVVEVLADLRHRARLPVFTVGTGLYLRALLEGLAEAPRRSDSLRARLDMIAARRGNGHLHKILDRMDRPAAQRISPNDGQKIRRALEICLLAGKPASEVYRGGRDRLEGYRPIKIGLNPPRMALRGRIDLRVHGMLARGWLNEVASLVQRGAALDSKSFEFIGYRQLRGHLEDGVPLAVVVDSITTATRQYAKRQLTWFRRETDVTWLSGFGDEPAVIAAALEHVARSIPMNYARP